ncbi:PucR family transcriptional regulator [Streptomyces sp. NBC_01485]|uniref:PucR family transcriptional regulator n=1 Tax=Streptomyces sp. NBC_01485 TaxID=2903884 RepID=UPI002E3111C2|nr:helix-turn-helix domain-containing protein [Streptomyces sp. NBC_01485]
MRVEHLLKDESLGLRLLWAEDTLLGRVISGVTVTDLEDPARFVRPGEAVLSGLVWWTPQDGRGKAERFVSALKHAGAAVLLAGEETHGSVPDDLVEACARHDVPVAGVPAHVMFRAITDTVYLRQWGDLSRRQALPEALRARLTRLVTQQAAPETILTTAFTHLDPAAPATAYLFTAAGRTVAATPGAAEIPARDAAALLRSETGATVAVEADAVSPYERRHLHVPDSAAAPPRMLHEIAAILGLSQEARARQRDIQRQAADELGALLTDPAAETAGVEAALRTCGLPAEGPYRVIAADTGTRRHEQAEGALAEVVAHAHAGVGPAAVGRLPDGTAFAVMPETAEALTGSLQQIWALVQASAPAMPLHGGTGAAASGPPDLSGALAQACYALASTRTTAPNASALTDATALTGLQALLTGIPADVRTAYSRTVLGPLLAPHNAGTTALLQTLETFLAHDGSWARTAEALHLHVNTVHYRIQRIEHFTGRSLSRLDDRLDLRAALLCHAAPTVPAVTGGRRARSSTSRAR